ncbi:MAG TPA: polysaccharide deacetylase family protein [Gemmatimonadales bacterium]|nr:polysaccharide deacetylase family protein [Gemmatimonadales bacterium]
MTRAARPPVLCYHRVGGPLELGVTRVRGAVFQRQMTALANAGWTTLTLNEFTRRAQPGGSSVPPPRSFLVSFDDGYASLAEHAYPVLADLGFTAVTFLVTDFVGRDNAWDVRYTWRRLRHLDWEAITQWQSRGFEFASHSASHARLTWLAEGERAAELERSRETLIRRLGTGAGRAVAYPFGARDAEVEAAARAAGYELGFGGVCGNGSLLNLSRVPVYAWDVGEVPLGLRPDSLGTLGRLVAHAANRCAVGTSMMQGVRSLVSGARVSPHRTPV